MKKSFLIISLFVLATAGANAQNSNAIIFTEQGEPFTVILNGLKMNATPATNVKLTDLNASFYKMKIIFADQANGAEDFTLYLQPGTERTINIKRNNKGSWVQRMVSEVPIASAPPPPPTQTVVVYNPAAPVYVPPVYAPPMGTTTTVQQTTTTTGGGNPENVSVGMNMGGVGMGMNVTQSGVNMDMGGMGTNVNMGVNVGGTGMGMDMGATTTQTTTTQTTTVTTGGMIPPPVVYNPPPQQIYQAPPPPQPVRYQMAGYNGPVGCAWPMSEGDFSSAKGSIQNNSFEDTKLKMAKQIFGSNCLTSSQVKDIMGLFSFESSKLDFAKWAYGYTYDLGNYYKVNDAFTFESSKDELMSYMQANKH